VVGPDKALWFTEFIAGKIGRITTTGTITEYNIPTPDSTPRGITAGPDGALWFPKPRAARSAHLDFGQSQSSRFRAGRRENPGFGLRSSCQRAARASLRES